MDTRTSPFRLRIEQAQEALKRRGLAAVLVPSSDPHISEYLPERWQGRQWLSGFTGSMGTLVVTRDSAAVFADSRYWTQAEAELAGSGIELVKIATGASTQHVDWLAEHLKAGDTLGVDGDVLGLAAAQLPARDARQGRHALRHRLRPAGRSLARAARRCRQRRSTSTARRRRRCRAPPSSPQVREPRCAQGASHHFVSTVDDIAWLFNLRGSDVSLQPGVPRPCAARCARRDAVRRRGQGRCGPAAALAADGVRLAPYAQAGAALAALPAMPCC
jgi:Xaa-Pro aminopeptidase